MKVDNDLANCKILRDVQGGDTGKKRVEHRNF